MLGTWGDCDTFEMKSCICENCVVGLASTSRHRRHIKHIIMQLTDDQKELSGMREIMLLSFVTWLDKM